MHYTRYSGTIGPTVLVTAAAAGRLGCSKDVNLEKAGLKYYDDFHENIEKERSVIDNII